MRKRILTLLPLLCLPLAGNAPQPVTYDNDTHFYYTYYLARVANFTPDEALRIASANVALDCDPKTEPFQKTLVSPAAQSVRRRFHAFVPSLDRRGEDERERNRRAAYERAWDSGNPGGYLHFYMDIFSHRGFDSMLGHAAKGHKPDFLSRNPVRAERMTRGVLSLLWEFRHRHRANHSEILQDGGFGPGVRLTGADPGGLVLAYRRVQPVLFALIAANDPRWLARPNAASAQLIVSRALREQVPDFSRRIRYSFDRQGYPTNPTLYNLLAPRVGQITATKAGKETHLRVPVERLVQINAGLRARVLLDNRAVTRVGVTPGANATVLVVEDPRLAHPGHHSLTIENPGPGGRIYRHQLDFWIDQEYRVRQQSTGRSVLIRRSRPT
jgi:hypothetical protein